MITVLDPRREPASQTVAAASTPATRIWPTALRNMSIGRQIETDGRSVECDASDCLERERIVLSFEEANPWRSWRSEEEPEDYCVVKMKLRTKYYRVIH
jgi:hypothetical protein